MLWTMSFLGYKNKSTMGISSPIQMFWRNFCQKVATSGTIHQQVRKFLKIMAALALDPFNNVIFYPQITGKSTEKKRFVSLFASYHQEDSALHEINYLHSHGSMLPTIFSLYLVIHHQRSLVLTYCVKSVCSYRWCETCNSSICPWSFFEDRDKVA